MRVEVTPLPNIRGCRTYREAMRQIYRYKKSLRSGFSFRRFSQMVGLKSPNYLHLVMQGQRNLSNELAPKVARVLGLEGGEKAYFLALVRLENSREEQEAESARQDLLVAVRKIVTREIPRAQNRILNQWYYLAVRELVFLKDFAPDPDWISEKLRGLISPEQAREALEVLISGDLIRQNRGGKWEVKDPSLDTGDATVDQRILQGHLEVLKAWISLFPKLASEEREFGFLNIPISSRKIPEFKERIRRFQDEIIGWLQEEKEADTLVQLGTYLVPITRKSRD